MVKPKAAAKPLPPVASSLDQEVAYLKAKADRVIFLLDASAMPDEVKTAWLTLLPEMSLAQVDRLIALLDEELTITAKEAQKHPEDEEFILKLTAAKTRYDETIAASDKRVFAQLAQIEQELNTLGA